jgi:hypothetical protein
MIAPKNPFVSDCFNTLRGVAFALTFSRRLNEAPLEFAELVFLRNRVTPVGRLITLNGKRGRLTASLAAACVSINVG